MTKKQKKENILLSFKVSSNKKAWFNHKENTEIRHKIKIRARITKSKRYT